MPTPNTEQITDLRPKPPTPAGSGRHTHYHKGVSHLQTIDVYRVLDLFGVTHPAIQHAVKKLLCAGQRGAKDYGRDLREAYDSSDRALQMIAEDCNKAETESDAEGGWIDWSGGDCPVADDQLVDLRLFGGQTVRSVLAGHHYWCHPPTGIPLGAADIVAYRLSKQPTYSPDII